MRVVVDIQSAVAQRAGVGRYTKCLVEHLAAVAGADELALFYFDFLRRGVPVPVEGARPLAFRVAPGRLVQKAWKTLGWPPFDRLAGAADVYHFPNFVRPPLRRGKSVVTIHDLGFLRFPETTEAANLAYLRARLPETVHAADAIIAVSRFTAREIEELLGVPPTKIATIHSALYRDFHRPDADVVAACRRTLNLPRPYLLMVGTIEPRKNLPFLMEVFERLADFDGELVLAGMRGWKYEPIFERMRASARADRIRHVDYVPEDLLPALYAGAEVFVFPSRYEGFGFPPLEAMACGTPVVAATAGSLREVLGDAAEFVEGFDAEQWASSVRRVLSGHESRNTLIEKGLQQIRRYSWEETARQTWELYRQL